LCFVPDNSVDSFLFRWAGKQAALVKFISIRLVRHLRQLAPLDGQLQQPVSDFWLGRSLRKPATFVGHSPALFGIHRFGLSRRPLVTEMRIAPDQILEGAVAVPSTDDVGLLQTGRG
jgi:hypothetical protein